MVRNTDADDATDTDERRHPTGGFMPEDVSFDPYAIAAAIEAADDVPVCAAVAITNDFTRAFDVTAADGEQSDGDVVFEDADVLFEEKAVAVCHRDMAEKHYALIVGLPDRDDDFVIAINTHAIFG